MKYDKKVGNGERSEIRESDWKAIEIERNKKDSDYI